MKIVDFSGKELCELPSKPKDFDCGHKAGLIDIQVGDESVKLGRYTPAEASRIVDALCKTYISGAQTFTMPKEDAK